MTATLLIVEDNKSNMKLLCDLLHSLDYKTVCSEDGQDAVHLAKIHNPDIILMDIVLPGMSGLEYTKIFKADDDLKQVPIIAVTALAMKGDQEKVLAAGCDAYISKPIQIQLFKKTISDFLDKSIGRIPPNTDSASEHPVTR